MNMKSGAESGWDFSSRWFPLNSPANASLLATKTSQIIPVDLNSIIYKNARTLVDFNNLLNNTAAAKRYEEKAEEIKSAINSVLWDDDAGVWFDYDLQEQVRRNQFYPSNIFPLWAGIGCNDSSIVQRVLDWLHSSGGLEFPGGIPTSLVSSGQQWDLPNCWAPITHIFVEALENSGYRPARDLGFQVAEKWVANCYLTYKRYNNTMFEKYRTDLPGEPGGGGLYDVVVGFGWSNGVIIDFLQKYGERLSAMYNDIRFIL
ncbi:Trehalase [Orchesella cincta]|uniref:Trehalase n=1 Tax=Orchesella cincta TaxID=48709 RepID=A0A1D2MNV5_ORCCI|nr:Trehalase [Orchesella cincta]